MPSLAADRRHPGMTAAANNPPEEPNRNSPCQFSQRLRMSNPITIISEMIHRRTNTKPMTAAAVLALGDGCRVQRGKKKRRHPEHNLISSLRPAGREITGNVGQLQV